MKIAARFEDSDENNGNISMPRRFLGMGNAIHIFNPKRPCSEIYSTVIHELAHASHWNIAKSDYNQENEEMYRIRNSWARGVQYSLVRMKYPTYSGAITIRPRYTQLVVDLIDTEADGTGNNGLSIAMGDNVSGYTIRQIEDCLLGVRTWDQWRTKIYNAYPANATRRNLQTLFNSWR